MASATTLIPAVVALIAEYEATHGNLTLHARHRREAAQDAFTAAYFYSLDQEIDPDRLDLLSPDWVQELVEYSKLVSESLVLAMLDYRQRVSALGLPYEEYVARMTGMIIQICEMTVQEFWGEGDDGLAAA